MAERNAASTNKRKPNPSGGTPYRGDRSKPVDKKIDQYLTENEDPPVDLEPDGSRGTNPTTNCSNALDEDIHNGGPPLPFTNEPDNVSIAHVNAEDHDPGLHLDTLLIDASFPLHRRPPPDQVSPPKLTKQFTPHVTLHAPTAVDLEPDGYHGLKLFTTFFPHVSARAHGYPTWCLPGHTAFPDTLTELPPAGTATSGVGCSS